MKNYILDTNILLTYIRNTTTTQKLEDDLKLFSVENNLLISVVSLGEIKSIAYRNKWGKTKLEKLAKLLDNFLVADINVTEIVETFAKLEAYSQGILREWEGKKSSFSARNMGKHDLWIAATAKVLNLTLITTDKDFEHLSEIIDLIIVDLDNYKS